MSQHISLTNNPTSPPSFVDILEKAIEDYEDRTGENVSIYLGPMRDYQTPDGFRGSIQAQARDLNTQFPRLDFLINRVVTRVILFLCSMLIFMDPVPNIVFFANGVLPDVRIPFIFSDHLVMSGSSPGNPRRATRESRSKSYHAIMGFFNRIETFIVRLDLYTKIPLAPEMTKMVTVIMAEILSGLVLMNKQTRQGRFSKLITLYNHSYLNVHQRHLLRD